MCWAQSMWILFDPLTISPIPPQTIEEILSNIEKHFTSADGGLARMSEWVKPKD